MWIKNNSINSSQVSAQGAVEYNFNCFAYNCSLNVVIALQCMWLPIDHI